MLLNDRSRSLRTAEWRMQRKISVEKPARMRGSVRERLTSNGRGEMNFKH